MGDLNARIGRLISYMAADEITTPRGKELVNRSILNYKPQESNINEIPTLRPKRNASNQQIFEQNKTSHKDTLVLRVTKPVTKPATHTRCAKITKI